MLQYLLKIDSQLHYKYVSTYILIRRHLYFCLLLLFCHPLVILFHPTVYFM